MKNQRTTVHIAKPSQEEHALLRLLSAEEKLGAMVAAAKAKAARLGSKDSSEDSAGAATRVDIPHQDAE